MTLDALDLVSKSTSILASSKFFYFYTLSICSLLGMQQIYDCNFGLLLAALSLPALSSRFCQHYLSVLNTP